MEEDALCRHLPWDTLPPSSPPPPHVTGTGSSEVLGESTCLCYLEQVIPISRRAAFISAPHPPSFVYSEASLTQRKQRGYKGLQDCQPHLLFPSVKQTEAIQASGDPCHQHSKQLPGTWGSAPRRPELCFLVGPQSTEGRDGFRRIHLSEHEAKPWQRQLRGSEAPLWGEVPGAQGLLTMPLLVPPLSEVSFQ